MIRSVCVAGAGVIGSLLAGHLARVADVSVLARRDAHARALNEQGLRVSGRSDFTAAITAATEPSALPDPDLVIVACKGTDLEALAAKPRGRVRRRDGDDGAERTRSGGDRRRARRLAAALVGHVHERHAARGHARRVHPRHGHVDRPVPRHDAGAGTRGRRPDRRFRAEGGGVRRPAAGAVVEADLQRDRQRRRRADRAPARLPLRRDGTARRPRQLSSATSSTRGRRPPPLPGSSCGRTRGR